MAEKENEKGEAISVPKAKVRHPREDLLMACLLGLGFPRARLSTAIAALFPRECSRADWKTASRASVTDSSSNSWLTIERTIDHAKRAPNASVHR
jgi:hypothetical protein